MNNSRANRVLLVSQVIPQWYIDLLKSSISDDAEIDCITGSHVIGVNRIPAPQYDPKSIKTKFLSWIKYCLFLKKWEHKNKNRAYNLIFAVSNPPLNAFLGIGLKKRFHAPFVFMNWDLYPQSILAVFSNPIIRIICKMWTGWNNRYYPQIDQIITIGEVMAESINKGLKAPLHIEVFPIAADTEKIRHIPSNENPFRIQNGLGDKFVVLYSGNMGVGHNMTIILDAAKRLLHEHGIQFVLIGDGPLYTYVKSQIAENDLNNVSLFPLQSEEVFPFSVACGDVAVVSEDVNQAELFIPSKTFSFMAAGEAIIGICSNHDDLQRLIDRHQIGMKVTSGNANDLVEAILSLYRNSDLLRMMQERARKAAEDQYSLQMVAEKYKVLFERFFAESGV